MCFQRNDMTVCPTVPRALPTAAISPPPSHTHTVPAQQTLTVRQLLGDVTRRAADARNQTDTHHNDDVERHRQPPPGVSRTFPVSWFSSMLPKKSLDKFLHGTGTCSRRCTDWRGQGRDICGWHLKSTGPCWRLKETRQRLGEMSGTLTENPSNLSYGAALSFSEIETFIQTADLNTWLMMTSYFLTQWKYVTAAIFCQ